MKLQIAWIFSLFLGAGFCIGGTCTQGRYPWRGYSNVTSYAVNNKNAKLTRAGVKYWGPDDASVMTRIDRSIAELERCLETPIRRDWIGVIIPADTYVSACSGQRLVPSTPPCRLCIDQKGLPLPEACCGLRLPTKECPCVCNMRSVVQDNWLIVTTVDLVSFKAELARLVTGVSFPWGNERILKCLGN